MDREIKFRYWDNVLKHYFYSDEFEWPTPLEKLSYFFAKAKNYAENVEQWTGLKDKNGKEIYEGDIVDSFYSYEYEEPWGSCSNHAYDDFSGTVKHDADAAAFFIEAPMLRSGKKSFSEIDISRTEIVGNIHEARK
jgi:uncharacterized phage protein (TIGR01671 family)